MSQPVTFDELGQTPVETEKPFFAIDFNNEDELLTWLKATVQTLQTNSWMRLERVRNNYLRYKGIQYLNQVYQPRDIPETRKRYMPQMLVPLIKDSVDEKVARMLEKKPTIAVIPLGDETTDKVDSKIAKRFLGHIERQEKLPEKYRNALKSAEISGECIALPRWNPDKGPKLADTMPVKGGEVRERGLYIGDVEIALFTPHYFFYEEHPSKKWEDVNYIFTLEYEYTEGLKQDYPGKAGNINSEAIGSVYFDYETMSEKPLAGFTKKITFHHRSTKYLPNGFEAVFTNGALLKKGPLPDYYDGKMPAKRLIMLKNEEELHGESPLESVRGMASQVNNVQNKIIKNLMLMADAKWMVEEGSVEHQQLNSDVGIIELKRGSKAPILAQANPVSPQLIEHKKELMEDFYRFAKSNSVVQGSPPAGVTAFVALQYVSESESRRLSTEENYFADWVIDLNESILKICGAKYLPDQPRTMMVQGKDNRWNMMKYDPSSLAKDFAVTMQNMTGLPDSRSARVQAAIDLNQEFPGLIDPHLVAENVGFGLDPDRLTDAATNATRAAEEENESMLDGGPPIEPAPWEDLIVHWKIHVSAMQDPAFKTKLSPKAQQTMQQHLMATEMLMWERAQKMPPPMVEAMWAQVPQFPCLFQPPPPPPMPIPQVPQPGPAQ